MQPTVTKSGDWALAGDGCVVVFVKSGGKTILDLPEVEFTVSQMLPKTGGSGTYAKMQGKAVDRAEHSRRRRCRFPVEDRPQEREVQPGRRKPPKPVNLGDATVFSAIEDFGRGPFDRFVPNYVDNHRKALAINAAQYPRQEVGRRDAVRRQSRRRSTSR